MLVYGLIGFCAKFPYYTIMFTLMGTFGVREFYLSLLMLVFRFPWVTKSVMGFLTDNVPYQGKRRVPYMFFPTLFHTVVWIVISFLLYYSENEKASLVQLGDLSMSLVLACLLLVTADVALDGVIVEHARLQDEENQGFTQSLCFGARAIGETVGVFLGAVVFTPGFTWIIALCVSVVSAAMTIPILSIPDQTVFRPTDATFRSSFREIFAILLGPHRGFFVLAISVCFVPIPTTAIFYMETKDLGLNPVTMGVMSVAESIGAFFGILVYSKFYRKKAFYVSIAHACFYNALFLTPRVVLALHVNTAMHVPDIAVAGMSRFAMGNGLALLYMPIIAEAMEASPPDIESTFYSTVVAIVNVSIGLGTVFGSVLTEHIGVREEHIENAWVVFLCFQLAYIPVGIAAAVVHRITSGKKRHGLLRNVRGVFKKRRLSFRPKHPVGDAI